MFVNCELQCEGEGSEGVKFMQQKSKEWIHTERLFIYTYVLEKET